MSLKKLYALALGLSTLLAMPAHADYYEPSCCPQYVDCCNNGCLGLEVYADYLYWRTRRCQLDYAVPFVNATNQAIGDLYSVTPHYDSGYRIGVLKEFNRLFFDLAYTHFRTSANDSVQNAAGNLRGTLQVQTPALVGVITDANGRWNLDYDTFDLLVGYEISNRRCFQSYAFSGFKYASIDQKLQVGYANPGVGISEEINTKIDMNGYGLTLGFGAKYTLCHFNLFAKASYDVLATRFKRNFTSSTSIGGTFFDLNDNCWALCGVYNAAVGIGYEFNFNNCWCNHLGLSLGYEFHEWTNALDFIQVIDPAATSFLTIDRHLQSLGFDGLFARVAIGF